MASTEPVERPDGSVLVPAALAGAVRRILVRDLAQRIRTDGGAPTAEVRRVLYALGRAEARYEAAQHHQGSEQGTSSGEADRVEISTREAADLMGCSAEYVRRLCRTGRLAGRRLGPRTWAVSAVDLGDKLRP